jgi:hypothetical protein
MTFRVAPPSHTTELCAPPDWRIRRDVEDLLTLRAQPYRQHEPEYYGDEPDLSTELMRRIKADDLPRDVAAAVVPRLWLRLAPCPIAWVAPARWRRLWAAAGYSVHGEPAERPTEPVTLYRGGSRDGWSWTDDPQLAAAFATGLGQGDDVTGRLWKALVPPGALLGLVPLGFVEETGQITAVEAVVDPALLRTVEPWDDEDVERFGGLDVWDDSGAARLVL